MSEKEHDISPKSDVEPPRRTAVSGEDAGNSSDRLQDAGEDLAKELGEALRDGSKLPTIDLESYTVNEAASALSAVFRYATSLRERTIRSATAFAGAVRESSDWLVPNSFRNARSYAIFARQMLEYVNDAANVRLVFSGKENESEKSAHVDLARKTVGNLFDMTALATFSFSPITVLAVYSDLGHGDSSYLIQLSDRLKEHAIVDSSVQLSSSAELADAIAAAAGGATDVFDQPPIATESLRRTIAHIQAEVDTASERVSSEELGQLWRQMQLAAQQQSASMWDISATISVVTLSARLQTGEATPTVLSLPANTTGPDLVDQYWNGLRAIERDGLIPTLSSASEPYMDTIWSNFAVNRRTWTEQLLTGELTKWGWSQWSWPRIAAAPRDT